MREIQRFPTRERIQGSGVEVAGRVRKGDPMRETEKGAKAPGRERPWFRIEWNKDNPLIDPERAQRIFEGLYGKEPMRLSPVAFLRDNPATVWGSANELYGRSASGNPIQKIACDGEEIYRWRTPEGEFSHVPKACESKGIRACGCQSVGRLFFTLPAFSAAYGIDCEFMLITQGTIDIDQISSALTRYTAIGISRLAFTLYRVPERVTAPNGVISTAYNVKLALESASVQRATAALTDGIINTQTGAPALPASTSPTTTTAPALPAGKPVKGRKRAVVRLDPLVCMWLPGEPGESTHYNFKGEAGVFYTFDAAIVQTVCPDLSALEPGKPYRLDFEALEAETDADRIISVRGV